MTWAAAYDWLKDQPKGKGRDFLFRMAERRATKARLKPKVTRGAGGIRSLTHKLDDVFSRYIRLRDRIQDDVCQCITCPKLAPWKEMDCGHFMSRGFMSTRWDEKNCAAQCRKCNRFQEGLHAIFSEALDKRWEQGTATRLAGLARFGKKKWMPYELEALITHYTQKVKEIQ